MADFKNRIKEYCFSSPITSAIAAALFAVAAFSLPNALGFGETVRFVLNIVLRVAVAIIAFFAAKACGFIFFGTNGRTGFCDIVLLVLGFLVCVNNFPIIGFISGNVVLTENARVVRYIFYCVAVGVAEESVFRGFITPLVGVKFVGKRYAPFLTVFVSSVIFALCHVFNVFSAGVGATALQVGYTFLTGGLFGAVFLMTKSVIIPALFHVIFDVGGLMFSQPFGIAAGNMWDEKTIIITAAIGVIATAAYSVKLLKMREINTNGKDDNQN
ncbi:MAG: CPBP family intramembrane metalloprotease [Clostridia bacterium]|nr:CPBP family intramembrane metalloprotease [Clostridia bacterium]